MELIDFLGNFVILCLLVEVIVIKRYFWSSFILFYKSNRR